MMPIWPTTSLDEPKPLASTACSDGWNKKDMANDVLRRGIEMIEELYHGIR